MGGAVSSGRDNDELIDNLMGSSYIRTRMVERVFRALDRADYMTPEARDQAYKDLAWRNGALHMSSPCIYSEVMEGLELKPGLSFLNVGSGTGYLSTLVGLILGSSGISHGIEVNADVVEYANKKKAQFIENSPSLDEFDFCEPSFFNGNGLCLAPLQAFYDRVYCGAGCPEEYHDYFKQLIKVGGIVVLPLNESLLQVRRTSPTEWTTRTLLSVSFATLRLPTKEEADEQIRLDELRPARLQVLARGRVRGLLLRGALRRRPLLRPPPPRAPLARRCPRRITIPIQDDAHIDHYFDNAEALHDLEDRAAGASEMNALLSLVLSMSHNRVAGAVRFDPLLADSDSDADSDLDDDAAGAGGDPPPGDPAPDAPAASRASCRGVITFEFQNMRDNPAPSTSAADRADRADHSDSDHDDDNGDNDDDGDNGNHRADDEDGAEREQPRSDDEGPSELQLYLGRGRAGSEGREGGEDGEGARRAGGKRPRSAAPRAPPAPPPARRARRYRSLPDDNDDDEDRDSDGGGGARGPELRRLRLSLAMRRAVRDLPLPPALRRYLNYGRGFQPRV